MSIRSTRFKQHVLQSSQHKEHVGPSKHEQRVQAVPRINDVGPHVARLTMGMKPAKGLRRVEALYRHSKTR